MIVVRQCELISAESPFVAHVAAHRPPAGVNRRVCYNRRGAGLARKKRLLTALRSVNGNCLFHFLANPVADLRHGRQPRPKIDTAINFIEDD